MREMEANNEKDRRGKPSVTLMDLSLSPPNENPSATLVERNQSRHHHQASLQTIKELGCPTHTHRSTRWRSASVRIVNCDTSQALLSTCPASCILVLYPSLYAACVY
jgi:hypothetical protein